MEEVVSSASDRKRKGEKKIIGQTDLKVDVDTDLYGLKYRKSIPQARRGKKKEIGLVSRKI